MKRVWIAKCFGIAASLFVLTVMPTIQGGIIKGNLWMVSDNPNPSDQDAKAHHALPQNIPTRAPDVTFDVFSAANKIELNFNDSFSPDGRRVGPWLSGGPNPAQNVVGSKEAMEHILSAAYTFGAIIEFTGSVMVSTGDSFTIDHDDGVTLMIGTNKVISVPDRGGLGDGGMYQGPNGTAPFRLIYAECCGGPALLKVTKSPVSPTERAAGLTRPLWAGGIMMSAVLHDTTITVGPPDAIAGSRRLLDIVAAPRA